MLRTLSLAVLVSLAAPALAQTSTTTVDLTDFKFTPMQIQLQANAPTILQLRNDSGGGHSFSALAFFAAARVDPASAGLINKGKIEVPAHGTVQVALTPAAGQYPLKCSHPFHATLGMTGTITVR